MRSHTKKKTKGERGIGTATLRSAAAASNALQLQLPTAPANGHGNGIRNGMKGGTCVHAVC